jgi:phosphoribosylformylglycinamidine synthase
VTDCLNFGNPERPDVMWSFVEAVRGLGDACRALSTPVVSGNVSLYNETEGRSVKPTPTIGMVGLIAHANDAVGLAFVDGSTVALLGVNSDELGGSEYLALIHGQVAGKLPRLDPARELAVGKACRELVAAHLIRSAHDCSDGGLAVALAECCIAGAVGARLTLDDAIRPDALWFGEAPSRIVVSYDPARDVDVRAIAERSGAPLTVLGSTGGDALELRGALNVPVATLAEAHRLGFRRIVSG